MQSARTVAVRSYRQVVDEVERRVYRIDRWRIPSPDGVSAAAIGYFLLLAAVVAIVAKAPLIGPLAGTFPSAVVHLGLPAVGAWAMSATRVDGRKPHHVVWAFARYRASARTRSGPRPCAARGSTLAPVDSIQIAPSGDEPSYRRGRIRGPARVILRYPAQLRTNGALRRGGEDARAQLARARLVRVGEVSEGARPLAVGFELRVPAGAEVRFD